ncbi:MULTISPECIES: hypothetical protein [Parachlamydia]|uniref:MOMP-like family protein n=2 Tax=Parachlamydia acanthamoebae TaxID=83552 RepID=F8L0N2_PARAV|nr:hypothetical protein [Parachlamydia acanthamoebae]KIA77475.1 hypothetical protein DB43_GF00170 [Parachlamydia acanthamoebae]CCB86782.1 putative uncharacterized protein [Parachlamydia acanthamoebae UV-7]
MKYLVRFLLPTLLICMSTLHADVEETAISTEQITKNADVQGGPFTLLTSFDAVAPAKFTKDEIDHQKLRFQQGETSLNAVVYYNRACEEGLALGVGYTYNKIAWDQNPFFDQQNFNAYNVLITGFTKRLCDWDWKAQILYALDIDHPDFDDYSTWDLLLWGRYTYSCLAGIHLGFYAQTGMEADRVVPVLGFDWQFSRDWKLNAVFPVKMSLVYTFDPHWCTLVAARFFSARCRVGSNEPLGKGIIEYRNVGVEWAIRYEWDPYITADAHIGYSSGGKLKISNRNHNHATHLKFDSAPYVGAMLNFNF